MGDFWRSCLNLMIGSGGALMMLVMIVFWIGVLALVVLGVRWLLREGSVSPTDRTEDPIRLLERRFAAGEIDREEFEQRRRTLLG